jgi:hypothetical protein
VLQGKTRATRWPPPIGHTGAVRAILIHGHPCRRCSCRRDLRHQARYKAGDVVAKIIDLLWFLRVALLQRERIATPFTDFRVAPRMAERDRRSLWSHP